MFSAYNQHRSQIGPEMAKENDMMGCAYALQVLGKAFVFVFPGLCLCFFVSRYIVIAAFANSFKPS